MSLPSGIVCDSGTRFTTEPADAGIETRWRVKQREEGECGEAPPKFRLSRLRARYKWFDRLVGTAACYRDRNGDHYAAAVTFFTVLSLVPLLMISASLLGFLLASNKELVAALYAEVARAVPVSLRTMTNGVLLTVVEQRGNFGVAGLLVAAYSGWSWIRNLRDAASAMWNQAPPQRSAVRTALADIGILLGIGVGLLLSVALTALGGSLGDVLLRLTGLAGSGWAAGLLAVLSPVLATVVNALILLWVLAKLPRQPVPVRSGLGAAVIGAVGFELLKFAGNTYLRLLSHSPTVATLGTLVGLLLFIYLVARLFLLVTCWTAVEVSPTTARAPAWARSTTANGQNVVLTAGATVTALAQRALGGGN